MIAAGLRKAKAVVKVGRYGLQNGRRELVVIRRG